LNQELDFKVLLEQGIPTHEINDIAKKEKNGRPPISEIHYWPTRKPLIVSRAVLLASISDRLQIEDFMKLISNNGNVPAFKSEPWRSGLYKKIYEDAMKRGEEIYGDLTIYDPFAGSGMIGFEALRLGFNVELSDYNPVAYAIMKATLEYPKKYGKKLAEDVKKEGERIIEEVRRELAELYPHHEGKEVKAYIWAWAVECKWCKKITPLVNDWALLKEKGIITYLRPEDGLNFRLYESEKIDIKGNVDRGKALCLHCGREISNEDIRADIRTNKREILLAVALEGKTFSTDIKRHEEAMRKAHEMLEKRKEELAPFIPTQEIPSEVGVGSSNYLTSWGDLFNDRQLLVIIYLVKKIKETVERYRREKGDDYARAMAVAFAMWVGKIVNRNCRASIWDNSKFIISHALTNQIGMMWKHAETNPFAKFSGSLSGMLKDVVDALKFSAEKLSDTNGRVEIRLASALSPSNKKYKLIVTDPPYYDDKPYGEISEFFYVWDRYILEDLFPEFSSSKVDVSESIDALGDRTPEIFYSRLESALLNLYNSLDDNGLLVLFFAHSNLQVWEHVLDSLYRVGFHITSAIPLATENENNVIARGKRSVYYSLVLTARKRLNNLETEERQILDEIREEIERNYESISRLSYERGELYLWAVGVALSVVTKYSKIKSFSTKRISETALNYAQTVASSIFLEKDMDKIIGRRLNLDEETLFYLSVLSGGKRELDTDTFNQLLKASKNIDQNSLERKKLIRKTSGKKIFIIVNDAYSRSEIIEREGITDIMGNSAVDWVHRCVIRFNARPGMSIVEDHAKGAGMSIEDFQDLLKIIHFYESKMKDQERGKEYNTIGNILDYIYKLQDRRDGRIDYFFKQS